jgi:hypothetical protein
MKTIRAIAVLVEGYRHEVRAESDGLGDGTFRPSPTLSAGADAGRRRVLGPLPFRMLGCRGRGGSQTTLPGVGVIETSQTAARERGLPLLRDGDSGSCQGVQVFPNGASVACRCRLVVRNGAEAKSALLPATQLLKSVQGSRPGKAKKKAARRKRIDQDRTSGDKVYDVVVSAGESVTVVVGTQASISVKVRSKKRGLIAKFTGRRGAHWTHVAQENDTLRIRTRAQAREPEKDPFQPAPSSALMIAVEPVGRGGSPEDGNAYLSERQQLLLALFGVSTARLHADTGLDLAVDLDKLELIGRAIAEKVNPPDYLGEHQLKIDNTTGSGVEKNDYALTSDTGTLKLHTEFVLQSGRLQCQLEYKAKSGVHIWGVLTHTISFGDGIQATPTSNPVGEYVSPTPEQDHAQVFARYFTDQPEDPPDQSEEGIGAAFEGVILGDFSDNSSWSAVGGQVAVGFVPIVGQIADGRDIIAAGSHVFAGEEGAWSGLGLSVLAIIPGLDFLKGGSKVKRKVLRKASERAVKGKAKAALKRLRKTLTKEGYTQGLKILPKLMVARRALLKELQLHILDQSIQLNASVRNRLRKTRNAIKGNLKNTDLTGALRDVHDLPVRARGSGYAWKHQQQVQHARNSMAKSKRTMKEELKRLGDPAAETYRGLSSLIDALSEYDRNIQRFLEIR